MATYVLVHAAFQGGWGWKRVAPFLRTAGHEVYTPTLTGVGERAHLATPAVDMDTHIQDVVGVLKYEDLQQVILVGHSYGGTVITGVADRAPERLAHLVYLDAQVPRDGESQMMITSVSPESLQEQARAEGEGWLVLPPPAEPGRVGAVSQADLQWVEARRTPQPLATYQQPLRLTNELAATLPRTYILCTEGKQEGSPFVRFARRAQAEGWRYRELATGHYAPITAPGEVADLLLELA